MTFWAELRSRYGEAYNEGVACFPDGKFGRGHYRNTPRWRAAAATIAGLLEDLDAAGPVLDLGCGQGSLTDELRRLGVSAVGVDLGDDVRCMGAVGNAAKLPFVSNVFGAVVALDIIEHVPHDYQEALWAELRRVLVPEGVIVATVPVQRRLFTRCSTEGLLNHYLAAPAAMWATHFTAAGFEVLASGESMARRGTPFAFGDVNYPFLLRSES